MIEAFFKQKGDRNQAAFLVLLPLGQKAHKFNQKNKIKFRYLHSGTWLYKWWFYKYVKQETVG